MMFCQQLRTFILMAVTLVRLGAASHFDCSDVSGMIVCTVTVDPGVAFSYSPDPTGELTCTDDWKYCARITGYPGDSTWEIMVTNGDDICYAQCPVQINSHCDDSMCWDTCETNAC